VLNINPNTTVPFIAFVSAGRTLTLTIVPKANLTLTLTIVKADLTLTLTIVKADLTGQSCTGSYWTHRINYLCVAEATVGTVGTRL
jgi:hypothetical protein